MAMENLRDRLGRYRQIDLSVIGRKAPVADSANNWVEVKKTKNGKYAAGVGKETFDVTITISTADGRILSASMDTPW